MPQQINRFDGFAAPDQRDTNEIPIGGRVRRAAKLCPGQDRTQRSVGIYLPDVVIGTYQDPPPAGLAPNLVDQDTRAGAVPAGKPGGRVVVDIANGERPVQHQGLVSD